jgi:hypothetical protein
MGTSAEVGRRPGLPARSHACRHATVIIHAEAMDQNGLEANESHAVSIEMRSYQ